MQRGRDPWVCPELPEAQKAALSQNVRAPLIYAKVLIANWTAFRALGAHNVLSPSGFWAVTKLDYPVFDGRLRVPEGSSEPMVLHMVHVPVEPGEGLTARDQWRMARLKLLESPFAYYEDSIRDQLQRMLGAGGFDAARDIRAITVNRWSHGYSYFFNPLFDDMEASEGVVEEGQGEGGRDRDRPVRYRLGRLCPYRDRRGASGGGRIAGRLRGAVGRPADRSHRKRTLAEALRRAAKVLALFSFLGQGTKHERS